MSKRITLAEWAARLPSPSIENFDDEAIINEIMRDYVPEKTPWHVRVCEGFGNGLIRVGRALGGGID